MANRTELREKIMTIIYQISLYKKNKLEYNVDDVIKENLEIENEYVKEMVYGALTYYDELVEIANSHLQKWTVNRLDSAGSAILIMSIYEMKYTDTPPVVVINEAIELAKKYSDEAVRKMINAVLDKIMDQ